jgi:CRP-like cAMP-binding protein|tara:strand:+ start:7690 stop:8718 length:1029 start_codon:yes stop_codon:yes gene_type:complete
MSGNRQINPALLKKFAPLDDLAQNRLDDLAAKARLVSLHEGRILFKRDEENQSCQWLVSGSLDLLDKEFNIIKVESDSEQSCRMLDANSPHTVTAIASSDCRILTITKEALDLAMTLDHSGGVVVTGINEEEEIEEDWMSSLLQSHLFELLPPSNIEEVFARFREINFNKGDTVIKQDEEGDYFYVIKQGRARIDRQTGDKTKTLAEIGPGACFGEDALVSDAPRNATITMLSQGSMMRLSKEDFQHLLQQPVKEFVTLEEVEAVREAGEQKVLIVDVRLPKEFKTERIESAVNIPLQVLRQNLGKLKKDITYITTCDGGRRSELAAYILNKAGFDSYILKS